ncbi:MAG: SWIM zinc finger family protein [Candidatus Latescibacteria bacterium]|nr:SWIM zinc finger family protein [Candidatus Latescibacterota bacterium]
MALPSFDEAAIRNLANPNSYYRGEEYFASGAVHRLVCQEDRYQARVQGTHLYRVRIWEREGRLQTSCTCPYDWGGICKHLVAVMLAILEMRQAGREIRQLAPAPLVPEVPVEPILEALSAEQLRGFVRLELAENPQVAGHLQIFAQGPVPTKRKVEEYEAQIAAALEGAERPPTYYEEEEYEEEFGEDEPDEMAEDALKPFGEMARRYQAQGNWMENAKIQEAMVRACAKQLSAAGEPEEEEDEDEDYYDEDYYDEDEDYYDEDEDYYGEDYGEDLDYAGTSFRLQMEEALIRWAEALSGASPARDKQAFLKRFVGLFAEGAPPIEAQTWEKAFQMAVRSPEEAKSALKQVPVAFMREPQRAGVFLQLLDLSGDTKRYIEVGKKALLHHPRLALPLGEKLVQLGRKAEAIKVAEQALKNAGISYSFYEGPSLREQLLRFLIRVCDPRKDYARRVRYAEALLFAENQLADYLSLRDFLRTTEERAALIQKVKTHCEPSALIEIFSAEERWKDLLDCARKDPQAPEFPRMIELLRERFPAECFKLYQKVLWQVVDSGTGRGIYQQAASHARQLQKIPGHEEAFAQLILEITSKYSRRSGLIQALGELVRLGQEWRGRAAKSRLEKLTPKQLKQVGLEELGVLCPIQEEEWKKVRGFYGESQRAIARLIWAILTRQGGTMEAAAITEAIAQHRGCRPQSAAAQRSIGLNVLKQLAYVEIERKGNRLGTVRLTKAAQLSSSSSSS